MAKLYFLGICGTFMGSLAVLARQLGHEVAGCDANVYPPMSEQLQMQGIQVDQGYQAAHLQSKPELVIVGNAVSRGNPVVEAMLEQDLRYTSGPQWLSENVLDGRHVLALAGTHGKTTTSSMLAWILRQCGDECGYLIGGVPLGFAASADIGKSRHFVIEADEYDTAFFDKRSKFVHYRPRTLVINNLEYDHADIFADLEAIQWQFHQLLRTLAPSALILVPEIESSISSVLAQGCWSRIERFALRQMNGISWWAEEISSDGRSFAVMHHDGERANRAGRVDWHSAGLHNVSNALVSIAAAADVGISPSRAVLALSDFPGVKRRLEVLGSAAGVTVIDDFAHHPTAIKATLAAVRAQTTDRVIAVIEPRSNSMRLGVHHAELPSAVESADRVLWYQPETTAGDLAAIAAASKPPSSVYSNVDQIVAELVTQRQNDDTVVIMSNGGFGNIHKKLLRTLREHQQQ